MRPHWPRFLIGGPVQPGEAVALAAAEARHARVRRLAVGDEVALFDGNGRSYVARLEALSRDGAIARVIAALPERDGESPLALVLATGALKADRFDWVVEKATELGVHAIQPFTSRYTLAEPSSARQARWRQIALAAAKQSGRSVVPAIAAPVPFAELLRLPAAARLVFAEDGSGGGLETVALGAERAVFVIVGGEGGFAAEELAAARAAGGQLIGLGPRILRAETAALTAVALCQARWGDLRG